MNQEQRVRHARSLLNNPLLAIVVAQCREGTLQRWVTAPDTATRELCWMQMQTFNSFETQLTATLQGIVREPGAELHTLNPEE